MALSHILDLTLKNSKIAKLDLFIKFQFILMYEYYFALKCLQLMYYNFLFVFQALEFANNSEIVCQQNFRNSKIDRIIDRIFKLNAGQFLPKRSLQNMRLRSKTKNEPENLNKVKCFS